ncbi:hypothetical protein ABH944_002062 [Caballeronia udeis]|uniref:Uncharacterized protein n=1 Tax=Caballeronia udeis TaxID=1232866 RepID=A0ABW8MI41_9BURK
MLLRAIIRAERQVWRYQACAASLCADNATGILSMKRGAQSVIIIKGTALKANAPD